MNNNMTRKNDIDENIIIETEKKFVRNTCEIIIGEKKWKRNCPKCNSEIFYNSVYSRNRGLDRPCKKCSHIGLKYKIDKKIYTIEELSRKCPTCNNIIKYKSIDKKRQSEKNNKVCRHCVGKIAIQYRKPINNDTRMKMSIAKKGKTYNELNIKVDLVKRGENISKAKKGKKFTLDHRIALRQAKLEFNQKYSLKGPSFNPKACEYFDKLNKENGWNLQHAMNGGEVCIKELGYWPDAYDMDKNIIVEYDEPYHYKNGTLRIKDIDRMNFIVYSLGCKFLRYNEKKNELKKYYE